MCWKNRKQYVILDERLYFGILGGTVRVETITLKYGNTNSFFIPGGLLVDTGYAGTLAAFYKALKANGLRLERITNVMATHYHPDHCGLIGELQQHGVRLILPESQKGSVHDPDHIFERDGLRYIPVTSSITELPQRISPSIDICPVVSVMPNRQTMASRSGMPAP